MARFDHSDQPDTDGRPTENMLHAAVSEARSLSAHEAASFLEISPATLRAWEQAFGFPTSVESEEPAPNYLITELVAIQDALPDALSITSAIHTARRRLEHTL
jgi:hypothetical protein